MNNCDILKSKLILCEWNALYFLEIAFIGFTLHEIKQCIVFFWTPGIILLAKVLPTTDLNYWIKLLSCIIEANGGHIGLSHINLHWYY